LVGYETGPQDKRTGGRALVDVAAGTVTATYASPESGYGYGGLDFSGTHVTWFGYEAGTGDYITSVDRKTGEQKKTVLGAHTDGDQGRGDGHAAGDRAAAGDPAGPRPRHGRPRQVRRQGDPGLDAVARRRLPGCHAHAHRHRQGVHQAPDRARVRHPVLLRL